AQAHVLPVVFASGNVAIVDVEFEGDVAPRPGGDKNLTITDWVQVGRFAAGLDEIGSASEFARADCAPRASKGNGGITVSDWVQAGRYTVGLDPLTPAGGPSSPGARVAGPVVPPPPQPPGGRTLCVLDTSILQRETSAVSVRLEAQGNENGLEFSVAFDPAKLRWVGTAIGTGASTATLNVNTNSALAGRLGVILALPPGNMLAAGTREIAKLSFAAVGTAPSTTTISFGDQPLPREIADVSATPLETTYTSGTVSLTLPAGPPLTFSRIPNTPTLLFSWPATNGYYLETTTGGLRSTWVPATDVIVVGDQKIYPATIGSGEKYFRLKKQ
ncbi:MAG TPA: cohesin domain-containing protein, partial [Candidatus Eisenbacteria bacterium]|nr:cohesin domain-containing protein [Candidatus Eisenbacteria bacterium]